MSTNTTPEGRNNEAAGAWAWAQIAPALEGRSLDDGLARLIAWELIGRSVNELYELAREYSQKARVLEPTGPAGAQPQERYRYALAMAHAAGSLAGDYHGTDEANNRAPGIAITGRENLEPILEAAYFGLERADEIKGEARS